MAISESYGGEFGRDVEWWGERRERNLLSRATCGRLAGLQPSPWGRSVLRSWVAIIVGVGIYPEARPMTEVTRILSAIEQGDPQAAEQLLPLVYDELRKLAAQKMAHERSGQTLQATALVHEAYIRLVDVEKAQHWNSRGHFFAAAAEAMRRILVEKARWKGRDKQGAGLRRHDLRVVEPAVGGPDADILAIDEALSKLAAKHPEKAELVKLRYFAGLTHVEAACLLGMPIASADRHWRYARAWLAREMRRGLSVDGERESF
jgi:RNA polymerase sigma factor (TIGR02999 family)